MELLRTYDVPNDWKELEEEEEHEYSQRLLSTYGPFSVVIYARIKNGKLFTIDLNKDFSTFLIEFYAKCMTEINTNESAFKDLKKLVELFPYPNKILRLVGSQRNNVKEMLFIKITTDIQENYHKSVERPLFKTLQKKVFPLALKFYSRLEERTISEINNLLKPQIDKSISLCT